VAKEDRLYLTVEEKRYLDEMARKYKLTDWLKPKKDNLRGDKSSG